MLQKASLVGIYNQQVADKYFLYPRPQEGSHLSLSALPHSLDDLESGNGEKQYHSGELVKEERIFLHIDHDQAGVEGLFLVYTCTGRIQDHL